MRKENQEYDMEAVAPLTCIDRQTFDLQRAWCFGVREDKTRLSIRSERGYHVLRTMTFEEGNNSRTFLTTILNICSETTGGWLYIVDWMHKKS